MVEGKGAYCTQSASASAREREEYVSCALAYQRVAAG